MTLCILYATISMYSQPKQKNMNKLKNPNLIVSDESIAPGLETSNIGEITVPSERYLRVPFDSPHLGQHTYKRADGQELVADVVLQIQADDVRVDLVHHGDRFGLVQTGDDGSALRSRAIDKQGRASIWTSDPEGQRGAISVQEDNDEWVIYHTPVHMAGGDILPAPNMTVAASSDAELSVTKRYRYASERRGRAEAWKKYIRRGVGAIAVYGVFMSGGGLDRVMDPFVSSDRAVERVHDTIDSAMWDEDSILDGIAVKDYSDSEEIIELKNADYEQKKSALSAIQVLMSDLDSGNYEAIRERADNYAQSNYESIIPSERTEQALEAIADAQTSAEVAMALQDIGDFYGIDTHIDPGASLGGIKNTASGIVRGLTPLPKTLVDDARLGGINISSVETVNQEMQNQPGIGGYFTPASREITIKEMTKSREMIIGLAEIPGAQPDIDVPTILVHELAHALPYNRAEHRADYSSDLPSDIRGSTELSVFVDFVRGGLLSYPETITTYSRSSAEEHRVETLSGVIGERTGGLAHPNETRRYNSPANQDLLQAAAAVEQAQPGMVDYLVANNSRLVPVVNKKI